MSKLACEKIAYTFSFLHKLNVSILRLGPIVGPNMKKKLTIYQMIDNFINKRNKLVKISNSYVSFLSEKEASEAILKIIEKNKKWSIFNITGNYLQIKFLFRDLLILLKQGPILIENDKKNVKVIRYSNKLAKKELEWTPSTSFKKIIKSFITNNSD